MNHRYIVGVGVCLLFVLLAGCSSPAGSIDMAPVSNQELTDLASRSIANDEHRFPDKSYILNNAIPNGSVTITGTNPPIRRGLPFHHNNSFYNISYTVINQTTGTAVDIEIDYNATNVSGTTIAFKELPPVDKAVIRDLFPPRREKLTKGVDFGVGVVYTDSERSQSILLSKNEIVLRYQGEKYQLVVGDSESVTIYTYRYTATKVANSVNEYASHLKNKYLFTLSNLSKAEKSVINKAIDGGYRAEDTNDTAFKSVLSIFQQHKAVTRTETSGKWIVRYQGDVYWVDLYIGEFAESESET
ncbi:MAG: hypothetical protein ABEI06_07475 [Halobacteriaceae archaeon]